MKKCVFAGSFDPVTVGHEQTVIKCLKLFDEVVVGLLDNPEKTYAFSVDQRLEFLQKTFFKYGEKVRVVRHQGLLVDLLKKEGTPVYVRGIRNAVDYAYENQTNDVNTELYPEILTVYLPCEKEYLAVSSGNVRTLLRNGKDVEKFLPAEIVTDVQRLYKEQKNV